MSESINREALKKLSYGLYIVSSILDGKKNGQLANTVFQVTSEPPQVAISLSKNNLTHEYVEKSGIFSVSILSESTPFAFIGLFGFRSGRVIDKFEKTGHKFGISGCPIVIENAVSAIEARVVKKIDNGSHTLFIGEIINAEIFGNDRAMTYSFYQENLKGKTPKDSPTFIPLME
jgi:ferric-chelate reductase [NAD(P)H]